MVTHGEQLVIGFGLLGCALAIVVCWQLVNSERRRKYQAPVGEAAVAWGIAMVVPLLCFGGALVLRVMTVYLK